MFQLAASRANVLYSQFGSQDSGPEDFVRGPGSPGALIFKGGGQKALRGWVPQDANLMMRTRCTKNLSTEILQGLISGGNPILKNRTPQTR